MGGHFVKQNEILETDKFTNLAPRVTINDVIECRDEFKSDDANRYISQKCKGAVQCVVSSQKDPNCIYYGIQLDEPSGHCDGAFEGTQFWKTKANHAAFVKVEDDILSVYRESKDKWFKVKRVKTKKEKSTEPIDEDKPVKLKRKGRSQSHDTSIEKGKKPKAKIKNRKFAKDDVKLTSVDKPKKKRKVVKDDDEKKDKKKKKKKTKITISDADVAKNKKVKKITTTSPIAKKKKTSLSVPKKRR